MYGLLRTREHSKMQKARVRVVTGEHASVALHWAHHHQYCLLCAKDSLAVEKQSTLDNGASKDGS